MTLDQYKAYFEGFVANMDENHDARWDRMLQLLRNVKSTPPCPFRPDC